jgi:hypothetical protein
MYFLTNFGTNFKRVIEYAGIVNIFSQKKLIGASSKLASTFIVTWLQAFSLHEVSMCDCPNSLVGDHLNFTDERS